MFAHTLQAKPCMVSCTINALYIVCVLSDNPQSMCTWTHGGGKHKCSKNIGRLWSTSKGWMLYDN